LAIEAAIRAMLAEFPAICELPKKTDRTGYMQKRLILGFRVLAEECAGCDHRTHV
jgi:hypothetical protein